ncbi:MAG: hypothetical protein DCC71_12995 [Proteobacteria bacterium]|nr:MAG: hypothetical protein DCC71_12995 [Pseudomonadota bacterium]
MTTRRRPDRKVPLWTAALAAQLGLLGWLAGLGVAGAVASAALGVALGGLVMLRVAARWPGAVAMLALGGLGMTLGWWADLGFASAASVAAHARLPYDPLWCRVPAGLASLAGVPGVGHVVSWMNAGMLALGLPAMALARGACGDGTGRTRTELVVCALAMVAGMTAGSHVVLLAAGALAPGAIVLLDWAGMMAGMAIGMALDQIPRHAASATSAQPATVTAKPAAPA